ncbi:hypothetical protein IB642_04715 [Allofrancisella guangzhouensis]|uniref:Lipoprotein n=1 Tax=Allofrancisella guangzhouensis TaxID=594679 RepID=A0A0A8E2Z3_9GAMM|nr:hypothetical protein [Allofrancisella guangzhouensis]AJC48334.1 hypothetical protein SD28_00980 [Allofrancisella guangzhouensis]MBK2026576.1 hypothetical protein [Allofrancisella guangzhouensis]MBK2044320.1 hypothetical protein [Allofrancisella guangzhouensis]MBK2045563.1 hypothetical protein [Allofrancisella guangzhouensis]
MSKLFKKISLVLLIVLLSSCNMLTDDQFVYLGHGTDTPSYQLYYDKTKKLFILVDKRNGCFQKDDTGTCLAFSLQQTKDFRNEVLAKMIKMNILLEKDNYGGNYAISQLEKAGITTINKPIKISDVYATPVRQIMMDRQQQYHLVRGDFKIDANLVAMVVTNSEGKKQIKVAYTIDFPDVVKKYNAKLRPFVIDPAYLYTHMTMDAVYEAQYVQKNVHRSQKKVTKEVDGYLKKIVDESPNAEQQNTSIVDTQITEMLASLNSDNSLVTNMVSSGSSVDNYTITKSNSSKPDKESSSTTATSNNN